MMPVSPDTQIMSVRAGCWSLSVHQSIGCGHQCQLLHWEAWGAAWLVQQGAVPLHSQLHCSEQNVYASSMVLVISSSAAGMALLHPHGFSSCLQLAAFKLQCCSCCCLRWRHESCWTVRVPPTLLLQRLSVLSSF